jgi:hemin uptake protein HemP
MPPINPALACQPIAPPLSAACGNVAPRPARPPTAAALRRWQSAELLGAHREIEIAHGSTIYRLRLTSLGKLLLTK